jgi:nucleoside-diphosphate-sugar epimerase
MRVFITGATGVIGRRAVPLLVAAGHAVTAVERSCVGAAHIAHVGAQPIELDLFDARAVRTAVAGHEAVINLSTHMPETTLKMLLPGAWSENDRLRSEGARNIAEAALAGGAKRLIQESFAPVYPDRGERWIDERVPIAPERYNRTVADAERAAERFTQAGRDGIVLRFAAFYGPDAMQFNDLLRALRLGIALRFGIAPLPSSPAAYISSISHDDAAAAVVASLAAPAGAYNVSDDEPLTRRAYFDTLAKLIGAPPPRIPPAWLAPLFGSAGRLMARSQRIANSKLRAATGWAPRYPSVREGFAATLREQREAQAPPAQAA